MKCDDNLQCYDPRYQCDDDENCIDGSDESAATCKGNVEHRTMCKQIDSSSIGVLFCYNQRLQID